MRITRAVRSGRVPNFCKAWTRMNGAVSATSGTKLSLLTQTNADKQISVPCNS